MTNEERDLIQNFIARIGGTPANSGFSSVPATQPALPPVDREADAHIAALFASYPEARYRITQLAFMQEHALAEAQNQMTRGQTDLQVAAQRIQQLQQQLQQQQAAPQPVTSPWGTAVGGAQPLPQPQPQQPRGFFGGLFGGGQQAAPPPQPQYQQPQYQQPQYAPPAPQYAPGYQPGMFQRSGSGFLGSALTTAAGVAGGMVAGNALMNLFSGNHNSGFASSNSGFGGGMGGGFGGGGFSPEPSHYVPISQPDSQNASPWAAPAPDPYEVGGLGKDAPVDPGWQQAAPPDPGWQDAASNTDSGWQDASSGSDDP